MSRRRVTSKRQITPDPKFSSELISKFINLLMIDGKKSIATSILYHALDTVNNKIKKDSLKILELALDNVRPIVEVKSRRVGGATYQVPVEVPPVRGTSLAIRWIITSARKRKDHSMKLRLAHEIIDASENKGASVKKREDIHRIADANKAFAHYRW
ncbi:30S ribosomal protein S7 [Candidatus Schneideria nysicola]|uniref:30S ribosomal protein S7 n=1 Tax=Candidatus Schneideria nysicola TaxID=1081631 RepID=UPI001CAA5843|nr:30S ribosomal protein S7 [Candidatus Schneideria nysicola]UAJ65019.1 30S ribosomal protein S7 [Candidatus Schneideria nysicola]UAJ65552.1 30S ribosomal protein S7 [Candidatus Schneideria nysicola]UAJ66081.1 30S ribosomal protein S7 [Candidatus Schneideria nysicola]